jgi:hypothetical protein
MTAVKLNIGSAEPVALKEIFPSDFVVPQSTRNVYSRPGVASHPASCIHVFNKACPGVAAPVMLCTLKERVQTLEKTCKELEDFTGHPTQNKVIAYLKTALSVALAVTGVVAITALSGGVALAVAAFAALFFLNCFYAKDKFESGNYIAPLAAQFIGPFVPLWDVYRKEKALTDSIGNQKKGLESDFSSLVSYYRNAEGRLLQDIDDTVTAAQEAMAAEATAPIRSNHLGSDLERWLAEAQAAREETSAAYNWLNLPR